ncbi:MAG: FKBP-type peptidyl-prolyl cis-trans isomerase [Opitutaceae bacterium]
MKTIQKASLFLLALTFPIFLSAQESFTAAESAPEATEEAGDAYSPNQILEAWGWYLGQQIDLVGLNLNEAEVNALARGMQVAATGAKLEVDLEEIAPYVQEYLSARAESIQNARSSAGKRAAAAYFADLDADPNVIVLDSGLRYEVIEQGTGAFPVPEDMVVVHYTGKLIDGTVFDSSIPRGEPLTFQLNQVIPGWTQGLQKISEGGKIRLFVPSDLAYGDAGRPGIPPASALIFDVELLEVKAAIPEPVDAPAPGMQ